MLATGLQSRPKAQLPTSTLLASRCLLLVHHNSSESQDGAVAGFVFKGFGLGVGGLALRAWALELPGLGSGSWL